MSKYIVPLCLVTVAVTSCAAPRPPAPAPTENLTVGIAKTCTPSTVDLAASTTAQATIVMTNDGWCAIHTRDKDGKPFKFGLVKARPQHGRILIQKIGGETRVEYTADTRYVGADNFSVALASNSVNAPDSTVQVSVETSMGEGMAALPTAPVPAKRAAPPARPARPARTR